MIEIDKIRAVDHILVHENCSDGTASAMILKDVLPYAKITFMQYETEAHKTLEPEPGQLFCDLSPHRDRYKAFLDAGAIVLDHHKTAKGVVMPFVEAGLGAFGDEITDPGVCGAVLAFREVWSAINAAEILREQVADFLEGAQDLLDEASTDADILSVKALLLGKDGPLSAILRSLGDLPATKRAEIGSAINAARDHVEALCNHNRAKVLDMPYGDTPRIYGRGTTGIVGVMQELATLAGIRDTWQKQDPRFREACEQADALHWWPWEKIESTNWRDWSKHLLEIGPVLYNRSLKHVDKAIAGAYRFTSEKGRKVTVFEGTKPTSDAAEKMGEDNDLTVGFALFVEDGKQKIIFSTRSRGNFDCSAFAAAHGGGGHTKAAGFNRELKPLDLQPFALIQRLFDIYEGLEDDWKVLFNSEEYKNKTLPKDTYQKMVAKYLDDRYGASSATAPLHPPVHLQ